MKRLKVLLISLAIAVGLSIAMISSYACEDVLYVQDQADCHLYTRFELIGEIHEEGYDLCIYIDSGGPKHREESCDGGFILS
jgi:hypothetical protein